MTQPGPGRVRRTPRGTTASGRPRAPSPARPQGLATASLVLAACTIFLCPSLSPLTVVLGPFAWLLGSLDRKDAERRNQQQGLTGRLGTAIGRAATGALLLAVVLVVLFLAVTWRLR